MLLICCVLLIRLLMMGNRSRRILKCHMMWRMTRIGCVLWSKGWGWSRGGVLDCRGMEAVHIKFCDTDRREGGSWVDGCRRRQEAGGRYRR